jgi:hypothetical protein
MSTCCHSHVPWPQSLLVVGTGLIRSRSHRTGVRARPRRAACRRRCRQFDEVLSETRRLLPDLELVADVVDFADRKRNWGCKYPTLTCMVLTSSWCGLNRRWRSRTRSATWMWWSSGHVQQLEIEHRSEPNCVGAPSRRQPVRAVGCAKPSPRTCR